MRRSAKHYDHGDEGDESNYGEIIDAIDWQGADAVDDSSLQYKKDLRYIVENLDG